MTQPSRNRYVGTDIRRGLVELANTLGRPPLAFRLVAGNRHMTLSIPTWREAAIRVSP